MDGPKTLKDLGDGWSLRQWEYDGAPLELHGPKGLMLTVVKENVELEAEYESGGCCSRFVDRLYRDVPVSALKALLEGT